MVGKEVHIKSIEVIVNFRGEKSATDKSHGQCNIKNSEGTFAKRSLDWCTNFDCVMGSNVTFLRDARAIDT